MSWTGLLRRSVAMATACRIRKAIGPTTVPKVSIVACSMGRVCLSAGKGKRRWISAARSFYQRMRDKSRLDLSSLSVRDRVEISGCNLLFSEKLKVLINNTWLPFLHGESATESMILASFTPLFEEATSSSFEWAYQFSFSVFVFFSRHVRELISSYLPVYLWIRRKISKQTQYLFSTPKPAINSNEIEPSPSCWCLLIEISQSVRSSGRQADNRAERVCFCYKTSQTLYYASRHSVHNLPTL